MPTTRRIELQLGPESGLCVFAQTAADLDDAFQRVAAEILRLAK